MNSTEALQLNDVAIDDTFAEAFPMVGTRLLITAISPHWAQVAASELCGYATSVIACNAEAGVECAVPADETLDGRPGMSVLMFAFSQAALEKAASSRVGQCLLTCPTAACYNGIEGCPKDQQIALGRQLRFFGDGFQRSKKLGTRRFWRIPVMDGEFVCEERLGTVKGVAGGNLLICGTNQASALAATETAVDAMRKVRGTILPFPGGIVRSGSKVGSRYKALKASTNDAYCPTLKAVTRTNCGEMTGAVDEIVIDGLSSDSVQEAMRVGLHAACQCEGVTQVSAGNYGGKLGPHHFHLRDLL